MGGMGSRCACVAKGMGGSTGSGSGPGPLPPTGSGSGSGPLPPTVAPTGSGSGSGRLVRKNLSDYPLALCNDGTTAGYFYSEDALTNPNLMIYLKGGGQCGSLEECQNRCQNSNPICTTNTSSYLDIDTTMWSQDPEVNPPFHNFGKVYVSYCSSDVYSGTRNASADTNGYYFYGKHILEAVVDDIIKSKPDIDNMKQMVLIGTSAGGFGVAVNCDSVAEQFHAEKNDLDVRCIADGGDFYPRMQYESCDPYEVMAENQEKNFWQGVGDQTCIENSPEGSLDCSAFPLYYNYIETPFMVVHSYIDTTVQGPCTAPLSIEYQDFWAEFKQQVKTMANNFIEDKPKNGLFLSNCHRHTSSNDDEVWNQLDVPAVNAEGSEVLKNVIRNWLTGEGPYQAMDMPLEMNPKC